MNCTYCNEQVSGSICNSCGLILDDTPEFVQGYVAKSNEIEVEENRISKFLSTFIDTVSGDLGISIQIKQKISSYAIKYYNEQPNKTLNSEKMALILSLVVLVSRSFNNINQFLLKDLSNQYNVDYGLCIKMKNKIFAKFSSLYSQVTLVERASIILYSMNQKLPHPFAYQTVNFVGMYTDSFNLDGKYRDYIISACSFVIWKYYQLDESRHLHVIQERDIICKSMKMELRHFCLKFNLRYTQTGTKPRFEQLEKYLLILYRQFPWVTENCSVHEMYFNLNLVIKHWNIIILCYKNNIFKKNTKKIDVRVYTKPTGRKTVESVVKYFKDNQNSSLGGFESKSLYSNVLKSAINRDLDKEELEDDDMLGDDIEMYLYDNDENEYSTLIENTI
ncbi:hypothetical protein A3Q56_02534 [Intoshia linei]|uniref:Uncharacterized protein n=1 Tax=Intoshia linei TaxID=1819745 RepID=A0A177B6G6_9BILA|nr:hypothetical protein A3Q56_02534 [Intoshia linei]